MIFFFIFNTFSLQSKPFSAQVRRFFLLKQWLRLLLERDSKQLQLKTRKMFQSKLSIKNLLTITTQCTLNSTSQIHNLILWYPYLKTQCNSKMLLLKYIQTYLTYPDLLEGGAKGLIDCLIMKPRKQLSKRRKKSLGKICNMIFRGTFI